LKKESLSGKIVKGIVKKLSTLLSTSPMASLIYVLVSLYSITLRTKVENEDAWLVHLRKGGRIILCLWHQQIFMAIKYSKKYRSFRPSVMISKSRDGEMITKVIQKAGWTAVRGSSSKGGREALKELIDKVKQNGLAAHILDGPQGPPGEVKSGIIHLAQTTGAMVVPVFVYPEKAWYLKSWDRFMLPKPFSTIRIHFGDMICFPVTTDERERENQRKYLEDIMRPCLKL